MAMRFEQSIVINASADKVFAYVSDLERLPEWGAFKNAVRKTSDGPVGVGTTYETDGSQFGRHTDKVTVTEYVPGKKFTLEVHGDAGHVMNWFELADESGGTKLTKGQDFIKAALSTTIFSPVVRMVAPKGLMKDLQNIKGKIEASA